MAQKPKPEEELLRALRKQAEAKRDETSPEDVGVDVVARREADALYAELQDLRGRLADFESKYRMTFDEFQAAMGPGATPEEEQDYWEWSRLTEAYRLRHQRLQDALRRASAAVRLPESEESADRGSGREVV